MARRLYELSLEQIKILKLAADGYRMHEIADELGYCENTIKRKIHQMREILQAKTCAQAVAEGYRRGILTDLRPVCPFVDKDINWDASIKARLTS